MPVGLFTKTEIVATHGLEGGVKMTNKVIFANCSSSSFSAAIVEGLRYRLRLTSALFGEFSFDNCIDGVLISLDGLVWV